MNKIWLKIIALKQNRIVLGFSRFYNFWFTSTLGWRTRLSWSFLLTIVLLIAVFTEYNYFGFELIIGLFFLSFILIIFVFTIIEIINNSKKKSSNSVDSEKLNLNENKNQDNLDFSLRPSAKNYHDREGEFKLLVKKIENSSSSVVGIAGVRGAGKSSLALKLIDYCNNKGYFALTIHSPTGYESREFLLSIFQRICEETISKINTLFGEFKSLKDIGFAEERKLKVTRRLLIIGVIAVWFVTFIFSY